MNREPAPVADQHEDAPVTPVFSSVLCSLDGGLTDADAARQAAVFAAPGGRLEFLTVTRGWGYGADPQSALSLDEARDALDAAREIAREFDLEPILRSVDAGSRTDTLLEESHSHGLLVVGADETTRVEGILGRATPSTVVHKASCPVLVARRPPAGSTFPSPLLLADDGSESARRAAGIAADLAARHDVTVELISPSDLRGERARALAEDAAELYRAGLTEPVRVHESGHAAGSISIWAERLGVSLIVIGSRGLHGPRALASLSERVASRAPCSVLIARPYC